MGVSFDKIDGVIWYDGKLVPWGDANVHVLTHGLHYASCVFEGERAYGGTIFKSTEHSERLKNSGRILDFEIPWSVAEIDAAKQLVLEKNDLPDAYVRPVAWGSLFGGPRRIRVRRGSREIYVSHIDISWVQCYKNISDDEILSRFAGDNDGK